MNYRPDQVRLWPRILAAADQVDHVIAVALRDALAAGAGLELVGAATGPTYRLTPGTMPAAELDRLKAEKIQPRAERMRTIQAHARTIQHPWIPALQQAYLDLDQRCERGMERLQRFIQGRDGAAIAQMALTVLDRRWQVISIAQVLYRAGYEAYGRFSSDHMGKLLDLLEVCRQSRIPVDINRCHSWPVRTPDGWIWIVDVPNGQPEPVQLDKDTHKLPATGELVMMDTDLGDALAPLLGDQVYKEAV